MILSSDAVLDETTLRSPRKIIYLYYLKKSFMDQSIQKTCFFICEKGSTDPQQTRNLQPVLLYSLSTSDEYHPRVYSGFTVLQAWLL